MQQTQDSVQNEWETMLAGYPPLLNPKQVQEVSLGIIRANDIYKRHGKDSKRLDLDVRLVGGRVFVTRDSVVRVLTGKPDLPL